MSRLEEAASRILEPLFEQRQQGIDAQSLPTLAAWAVKTAMVLESLASDQPRFYSESERAQLRQTHTIPQRACVWLAACVEQETIYAAAKYLSSSEARGFHGFATTMAFGLVAIQVLALRVPALVSPGTKVTIQLSEGPWDEVLVPVWPVPQGSLTWPPRQGLRGEAGLEVLTERFNPAVGEAA